LRPLPCSACSRRPLAPTPLRWSTHQATHRVLPSSRYHPM
jgi:hypothetical protein